ncbi:ATP-NAD kinase family protein [Candidatus Poseidonia alphae]|uniref:ATP-NAD kinase family protein n=1 Tax=Candidatus Poseidonia alphae TaxID=1915863 RepID=UPI00231138BC|nr:ATP-NAD kinase family protein [Candidatus Poseidonia alphae]MDA8529730.1 ATP-NAD kinase family protein [Candidatus Poseidonia alphae]MDA8748983.1 ATP-NAD kinase family protein [Candidatus Poseidonia alphae]MDB2335331.1 ATP-NAD kinase family protein [Candidatus Poseidonia alphae]MDB2568744.1 ATP-NAD kinase family protein [Candidatus Poseidonia alphae]
MRIGIVVNPDAGLGGRLGFKGSDGRAAEARAAGAEDRAGPRMQLCLEHLDQLLGSSLNRTKTSLTLVGLSGRMGETWYYSKSIGNYSECIGLTPPETKQQDTLELVRELVDANVDAILYAGGDGTTRDIVTALEQKGEAAQKIPLIGVPGGVKMHSGCFATTPKAAAEVTLAFAMGDLRTAITEVMDLDEVVYQEGVWKVRMYGEAWTPSSPRFMQGAKEQVERASEEETIEGLAHHVQVLLEDDPDLMVIWGSGGTLRRMGEHVGQNLTLLGIDIYHGETLHNDLNESQLLEIISAHKESNGDARALLLLLSPMGGQGFLIGRGNLQLSPDVLRMVGHDNILGVATPSKLIGLDAVRIDTGDSNLDDAFQDKRFIKILQGFRTTRLIRVAEM